MKRTARQASRFAAIDRRVRQRRLQDWRSQQRFAREPAAQREQHLAQLRELYGRLDGEFSREELIEAEAALHVPPHSKQQALPLRSA
jgi:hypothetical protein